MCTTVFTVSSQSELFKMCINCLKCMVTASVGEEGGDWKEMPGVGGVKGGLVMAETRPCSGPSFFSAQSSVCLLPRPNDSPAVLTTTGIPGEIQTQSAEGPSPEHRPSLSSAGTRWRLGVALYKNMCSRSIMRNNFCNSTSVLRPCRLNLSQR